MTQEVVRMTPEDYYSGETEELPDLIKDADEMVKFHMKYWGIWNSRLYYLLKLKERKDIQDMRRSKS